MATWAAGLAAMAVCLGSTFGGDAGGVTYTIAAEEALAGPKPADPNYVFEAARAGGAMREGSISVNAAKVRARINPLVFGACFEDLNHEIYGGLYAQMIYGESFEEGPEKKLPPGWRVHADWLKSPIWEGMWCSEHGAIGMTGFRWYKLLWTEASFEDGTIECDLMQPAFDPNRPIGLMFRASGQEFGTNYAVTIDAVHHQMELRIGERGVNAAPLPAARFDEWVNVRIEVKGGRIRAFANGAGNPLIDFADPNPLPAGLVGFDSTESHGWFRNLRFDTGGNTYTPPLVPVRTPDYRGPVSQWWEPIATGGAQVAFGWDAAKPFNTLRSQKIEIRSGQGTAGIANHGLGRLGLSVLQARTYEGRLYLRGDYQGAVTVALQNADGSKTYATQQLGGVAADWRKFSLRLKSDTTDHSARFAVWIDQPGAIWVDQVVLTPTGDALFKGLPVRADIAYLVVDSGVTCIRLGGDFSGVPGFKWKTMLGDPDLRPQYNSCWYPFETRGWSIVEFLALCRAAGIQPIPCVNHDETPQDVADLVEFCNGPATTRWGRERAANGYAEPFGLKYVQLGNGFPGVERMAAVADALHAVDPNVKLLSGSIGHVVDVLPDQAHLREMRQKLGGKVHALGAFPYNFEVTGSASWQAMLDRLRPLAGALKIYSQEVNGGNHNLLRGLADAAFHNVTERNAGFVDIVNYCNLLEADRLPDNGWEQGRIFFDNHRAWLQPHAWAIRMAREHYQPLAVETTVASPTMTFKNPIPYGVPAVDTLVASSARSAKGDALTLKVVNFAPFPLKTKIAIAGMERISPLAKLVVLTGDDLKSENTAENQTRVVPVSSTRDGISPEFVHIFPAYSYTILDIEPAQ